MKAPEFKHSNSIYTFSWLFALPVLIDICTACTLFSLWIAWICFVVVCIFSLIRLTHGIKQRCWGFCVVLASELILVGGCLGFFSLSFRHVIETPVSNQLKSDDVVVKNPIIVGRDSTLKSQDSISRTIK